jgi:hypothetical protein
MRKDRRDPQKAESRMTMANSDNIGEFRPPVCKASAAIEPDNRSDDRSWPSSMSPVRETNATGASNSRTDPSTVRSSIESPLR